MKERSALVLHSTQAPYDLLYAEVIAIHVVRHLRDALVPGGTGFDRP